MSGVFGVVEGHRQGGVRDIAARMAAVMSHFPWYVVQHEVNDDCGIGLGRIGIGIFNRDAQPIHNVARTQTLVMAGELHNKTELIQAGTCRFDTSAAISDEQFALALYRQVGERFVELLEGAFVIAIWDQERQRLVLVNDRGGLYPTYLARVGRRLHFAPEIKALLQDRQVNRSLREDAIAEYVRFQRLLGDKTFFAGVTLLPPASILTYAPEHEGLLLSRYWDLQAIKLVPESVTFDEAVDEAGRLLSSAIAKMTRGQERIGVFLSGGLDSRGILGWVSQHTSLIDTFTFGQPNCRDAIYAERLAMIAGARHHYHPFLDGRWVAEFADLHVRLTEGAHSWLHMHSISMLADVRAHSNVNISGLGDFVWTDEDVAPRHLVGARDDIAFNTIFFEYLGQKYSWPGVTCLEERCLYQEAYYPKVSGLAFDSLCHELRSHAHLPYPLRLSAFNLQNHFSRHLLNHCVYGRSHIEYRLPYFDLAFMSFCYGLPPRINGRQVERALIGRKLPALARVPTTVEELPIATSSEFQTFAKLKRMVKRSINQLGVPLFAQHPRLYADYEAWLRTDLRAWAESILFDERTVARGIFRPAAVRSLMDRHLAGNELWTIGKLAPLITFEMMLRQLYDE